MPVVTFVAADGVEHRVEVETNTSVMQAALYNSIPGIDGDCGGCAACGTCHVHIDAKWIGHTGRAAAGSETDMLEFAEGANEYSRLACQIEVTDDLDGLIIHLPLAQH